MVIPICYGGTQEYVKGMGTYHLLGRDGAPRVAWWRPLLEFFLVLALFFAALTAQITLRAYVRK